MRIWYNDIFTDGGSRKMKKVTGYVSVRPLGCFDYEFYVEDNATNEEIEAQIDKMTELSMHYDVEEGYEEYTEVSYRKKV